MAVDQKIPPSQRFRMYVEPNMSDTNIAIGVHQDIDRQHAIQAWNAAKSPAEMQRVISQVAPRIMEEGETFDSVFDSIQKDMPISPEYSQENTQQVDTQKQKGGLDWSGFLEKNQRQGSGAGFDKRSASDQLRSVQEQKLLEEFNTALEQRDTATINRILETRLEAPDLLEDQWKIANNHVNQLGGLVDEERKKILADLADQKERQIKRLQPQTDEDKLLQQRLTASVKTAQKSGDNERAKTDFQHLLSHQMRQTQDHSLFTVYEEDIPNPFLLTQLSRLFAATLDQMQQQEAARQQEIAMAVNQQQNQQANNAVNTYNRSQQLAANQKKGNLKNRFNKALDLIGKAGPEAAAAVKAIKAASFIKEHWKPILIGSILFFLLLIGAVFMVIYGFISLITQQSNQNTAPIPGLTITVDTNPPGQRTYPNGKNIQFVVDVKYTGQYSITIADQIPGNATVVPDSVTGQNSIINNLVLWDLSNDLSNKDNNSNPPLPDSTPSQKHWQFKLTFSNVGKDTILHNTVTGQYASGSGPNSVNTNTTRVSTSTRQVKIITQGACSPSNLAQPQFFGNIEAGTIASCICFYESGGNPGSVNNTCYTTGKSADWSVGLFQINLDTNPQRCTIPSNAFSSVGLVCRIANNAALTTCTNNLKDSTTNINQAVAIYRASNNSWDIGWNAEKGECF